MLYNFFIVVVVIVVVVVVVVVTLFDIDQQIRPDRLVYVFLVQRISGSSLALLVGRTQPLQNHQQQLLKTVLAADLFYYLIHKNHCQTQLNAIPSPVSLSLTTLKPLILA